MKTTSLSRSSVSSPHSAAATVRHRVSQNRNTRHWLATAALIAAMLTPLPAQTLLIERQITGIDHRFTPPDPVAGTPGLVQDVMDIDSAALTNLDLSQYQTFKLRLFAPAGQKLIVNHGDAYQSSVNVVFVAGKDTVSHSETATLEFENFVGATPTRASSNFYIGDGGYGIMFQAAELYPGGGTGFTALSYTFTPAYNPANSPHDFTQDAAIIGCPMCFSYETTATTDPGPFVSLVENILPPAIPQLINYQGRVAVGTPAVNFEGAGQFKFAMVNADATATFWSNDGTSAAGSEPTAAVSLQVTKGLYSLLLGDTALGHMTAIPATVFNNPDVRLRVWFNDGTHGFQHLEPDQRIAAVGYAMMAGNVPDGTITGAKIAAATVDAANIAAGAVGTTQLATGAVQGSHIAAGAVGPTQLAEQAVGSTHLATQAVQSANIATGAVGTNQLADLAITGGKLRLGIEIGTETGGEVTMVSGAPAIAWTFDYPFTSPPTVSLLTPGWTLGPVSSTGFSATFPSLTPDNAGDVGQYTSLALVNGHPAISYSDVTNGILKYVRATNAAGTAWGTPVTLAADGRCSSLVVVDGNPAISYFDPTNGMIKYMRATDASGAAWGSPVILEGFISGVQYTSLAVIAGNPAVVYSKSGFLKFQRATDASGTIWGAPQTVSGQPGPNHYASLAVVDGHPAISYSMNISPILRYVRATDAEGTAWGAPLFLDTMGMVGRYCSLKTINGKPAVSYYDATNFDLKYVCATDATGTAWGTPVVLDSEGDVGSYTSLAVVDGRPAVTYYDLTNTDLKFIHATDAEGATWSPPVALDNEGDVGQFTSLAVVDGRWAVSYYDATESALKFLRVPDLRWQASDGSVSPLTAANVAAGAIGSEQLAANAVQSTNIAAGAVSSTQLAPNAVQSGHIASGAVGSTQLATNAVQSGNIANGAVGADQLAAAAVDSTKLATGAVQSANIAGGAVGSEQLASNLSISGTLTAGQFQGNGALPWQVSSTAEQLAVPNTGYVLTHAAKTSVMLPATANIGDVVRVSGVGAGWIVTPNSGQTILTYPAELPWTAHESNRQWQAIASSADGTKLVAVVDDGQIFTSTDSGVTWTARDITGYRTSVASSADGSKLVAAGDRIFTSTDSGATWTARTPDFPPAFWTSVASSADGTKLVAVQNGGQIHTSTDSGVTWTARDISRDWSSVASSADGTKLVAVEVEGSIHTSADSGLTWTTRNRYGFWTSVASSADGMKLVAVGYEGMIDISTDAGVTWTQRGNYVSYWQAVASSADGTKLVAAEFGGQIHISIDSGLSWLARSDGRDWWAVACSADGNKMVALEYAGRIYTWADQLTGKQGTTAALQYIGNGRWQPLQESQIAASAVGSGQLAAGAVTSTQLAANAVQAVNIASGAVGSSQLAPNLTVSGTLSATSLTGDGSGLTNIPASAVISAPPGMVLIPAGTFTMGDSLDGISNAVPVTVTLSAYYMSVDEVTLSQWQAVYFWATSHGYGFSSPNAGAGKSANHPVHSVNWYDVVKWCNARSEKEGLTPCYKLSGVTYKTGEDAAVICNWNANGYRLPTEAEWEKAARGGLAGQRFPWGDTITHNLANYVGNTTSYPYDLGPNGPHPLGDDGTLPYTTPVGTFAPNGYGLHDMTGNVWEWCWDWYGTPYTGGIDPRGPTGSRRVGRGGDWNGGANGCRAAYRYNDPPTYSVNRLGFRVARSSVP